MPPRPLFAPVPARVELLDRSGAGLSVERWIEVAVAVGWACGGPDRPVRVVLRPAGTPVSTREGFWYPELHLPHDIAADALPTPPGDAVPVEAPHFQRPTGPLDHAVLADGQLGTVQARVVTGPLPTRDPLGVAARTDASFVCRGMREAFLPRLTAILGLQSADIPLEPVQRRALLAMDGMVAVDRAGGALILGNPAALGVIGERDRPDPALLRGPIELPTFAPRPRRLLEAYEAVLPDGAELHIVDVVGERALPLDEFLRRLKPAFPIASVTTTFQRYFADWQRFSVGLAPPVVQIHVDDTDDLQRLRDLQSGLHPRVLVPTRDVDVFVASNVAAADRFRGPLRIEVEQADDDVVQWLLASLRRPAILRLVGLTPTWDVVRGLLAHDLRVELAIDGTPEASEPAGDLGDRFELVVGVRPDKLDTLADAIFGMADLGVTRARLVMLPGRLWDAPDLKRLGDVLFDVGKRWKARDDLVLVNLGPHVPESTVPLRVVGDRVVGRANVEQGGLDTPLDVYRLQAPIRRPSPTDAKLERIFSSWLKWMAKG